MKLKLNSLHQTTNLESRPPLHYMSGDSQTEYQEDEEIIVPHGYSSCTYNIHTSLVSVDNFIVRNSIWKFSAIIFNEIYGMPYFIKEPNIMQIK